MVNVTNRAHIHVRFGPLKLAFGHDYSSFKKNDLLDSTQSDTPIRMSPMIYYLPLALMIVSVTFFGASA
jgi:hypothetical protein